MACWKISHGRAVRAWKNHGPCSGPGEGRAKQRSGKALVFLKDVTANLCDILIHFNADQSVSWGILFYRYIYIYIYICIYILLYILYIIYYILYIVYYISYIIYYILYIVYYILYIICIYILYVQIICNYRHVIIDHYTPEADRCRARVGSLLFSWVWMHSIFGDEDPEIHIPSGKLSHNYGKSPFLMGTLTISMVIFNSFLYVYQRVNPTYILCLKKSQPSKLFGSWLSDTFEFQAEERPSSPFGFSMIKALWTMGWWFFNVSAAPE